jgi:hypothetical protein
MHSVECLLVGYMAYYTHKEEHSSKANFNNKLKIKFEWFGRCVAARQLPSVSVDGKPMFNSST